MNNFYERLAILNVNKALIIGILLAIVYYISAFDDGSQANQQLKKMKKQSVALELQKKEIQNLLSQEKELKAQLEKKEKYLSHLENHIPVQIVTADLHRQIDEYAQSASIEVKNKKPNGVIKGTYIDQIPVQLIAEGEYNQITQFLSFLTGSEKAIVVNNIHLKSSELKSNNKNITVELTLSALKQSNERLQDAK